LEIALRTLVSETEHNTEHDAVAALSGASSLDGSNEGLPTCSYIHTASRLSRAINLAVHQPRTRALGTALQNNSKRQGGLVL
jgi:hypothetical protein